MRKALGFVDIAKFLFAIGIVAIHSGCFSGHDMGSWLTMHGILRLAVPFFFCASGFFFYRSLRKSDDIKSTTITFIKRLIIPFVFWLVANLPMVIYNYVKDGDSISTILLKLGRGLVFYPWGAMWFVLALIVAVLLIVPFYKRGKLSYAVLIGLGLYVIGLLFNTYYFVVHGTPLQGAIDGILKVVNSMRNGVFEGMFFVSIGMFISQLRMERRIKYNVNFVMLLVSYAMLFLEIVLTKDLPHADDHSLFIMFIVVIPCLFLFLSGLPSLRRSTVMLRNYSTGIYFSHRFVLAFGVIFH